MPDIISLKEYTDKNLNYNLYNPDKFQCYLEKQGLNNVLSITPKGIRAYHHVGVIKFKNIQIEILPKLIANNNPENTDDFNQEEKEIILKNLLYMLSFTKNLNIKTTDCAKLAKNKNLFLEVLIREYADSLFEALKRSTPKNYIRKENNLKFLKGKLKFSEHIKYNCTDFTNFYVEYDEFSEDNNLNRLFYFVSTILYNLSKDNNNKKTLKFIMNYYSEITFTRFNKAKADKIRLLRGQQIFDKPLKLAKMFIENTSVELSQNKIENISLIWDMNKLFEEFIAEFLKRECKEINIKPQKGRKLLINDNRKKRNTFVDIFIEDKKVVIDTKYKYFETMNDIKNADIFQVSTYCLLHNTKNAILIYPQYSKEKTEKCFLNIDNKDEKYSIKFATVDLKYNDLKKEKEKIKTRLMQLINSNDG